MPVDGFIFTLFFPFGCMHRLPAHAFPILPLWAAFRPTKTPWCSGHKQHVPHQGEGYSPPPGALPCAKGLRVVMGAHCGVFGECRQPIPCCGACSATIGATVFLPGVARPVALSPCFPSGGWSAHLTVRHPRPSISSVVL